MLLVGDDWAEDHHDVYLMTTPAGGSRRGGCPKGSGRDQAFARVDRRSMPMDPAHVVIGIEPTAALWWMP